MPDLIAGHVRFPSLPFPILDSLPSHPQGPVGDLLHAIGRHNMRPSHIHLAVEAKGYRKLVTALYPAGDRWLASDVVFGVKKSLVVVSPPPNFFFEFRVSDEDV